MGLYDNLRVFLNGRTPKTLKDLRMFNCPQQGVYCWVSAKGIYVGRTSNFRKRWTQHMASFKIYGDRECLEFYILSDVQDNEQVWQGYAGFIFPSHLILHIKGNNLVEEEHPDSNPQFESERMNEKAEFPERPSTSAAARKLSMGISNCLSGDDARRFIAWRDAVKKAESHNKQER